MFNNILVSDHASRGAIDVCSDCLPGFVSDYNVVISRFTSDGPFLSLAQWQAQFGQDLHSSVATAADLFVNPTSDDYHLLPTSPARDTGTAMLAPAFDLDGHPRPFGAAFDVGAYELGSLELAGDYNQDGTVNAADYTVWRNNLGSGTALANDDTAGVGPDDYDRWKAHFGESAGSGSGATISDEVSSVPEPHASVLSLFTATVGGMLAKRWQVRRPAPSG